jgi:hypothetical protein
MNYNNLKISDFLVLGAPRTQKVHQEHGNKNNPSDMISIQQLCLRTRLIFLFGRVGNLLKINQLSLKLEADKMKDSCSWCTFCVLGAPRTRKSLIFKLL